MDGWMALFLSYLSLSRLCLCPVSVSLFFVSCYAWFSCRGDSSAQQANPDVCVAIQSMKLGGECVLPEGGIGGLADHVG
jgi:hypothetical protein